MEANRSQSFEEKRVFFEILSKTSMMSKKLWKKRFRLEETIDKECKNLVGLAVFQFHYPEYDIPKNREPHDPKPNFPRRKLYHWNEWYYPVAMEDLCFPQSHLDSKEEDVNDRHFALLPFNLSDRVEELKRMYAKIKAAEADGFEAWFEAVSSVDDHDFVCHNVEYLIGSDLENKVLWKMYIGYLSQKNSIEVLLLTYSKYCRCFQDDTEMYNEYEKMVQHLITQKLIEGFVAVPWMNPFPFENYDPDFFEKETQGYTYKRTFNTTFKKMTVQFDATTTCHQKYSLPPAIIARIRETASIAILQKLFATCKLMFIRFPKLLCHNVIVRNCNTGAHRLGIVDSSIQIEAENLRSLDVSNLCIANSLVFELPFQLSSFIKKIDLFAAGTLVIRNQNLGFQELLPIIKHGGIRCIRLYLPNSDYEADFSIESVLEFTPFVKRIDFHRIQCTQATLQKLSLLKFQNKIYSLKFTGLNSIHLEPIAFSQFVVTNCTPDARIRLSFDIDNIDEYLLNLETAVYEAAAEKWGDDARIIFQTS